MTDFIPVTEISERLGVGVRQVQRLARQGQIPSIKIGGRSRIPRSAWEKFLDKQSDAALDSVKEAPRAEAATA